MTRIGFVGISLMGLPMCRRLLAAGFPLTVWNRTASKCAPLHAAGATVADEAVALAEQSGVDARLLAPALAGGFADSKPLQILAPRMAESRFEPVQWKVQTLLKDLDNARQLARECGREIPLAGVAAERLRTHVEQGHGLADLSSIIALYREGER